MGYEKDMLDGYKVEKFYTTFSTNACSLFQLLYLYRSKCKQYSDLQLICKKKIKTKTMHLCKQFKQ